LWSLLADARRAAGTPAGNLNARCTTHCALQP
jgi:hypothetical protein